MPHMTKTFRQDNKWIESPRKIKIVVCKCGNKYIKTRDRQTKCLRCLQTVK